MLWNCGYFTNNGLAWLYLAAEHLLLFDALIPRAVVEALLIGMHAKCAVSSHCVA